jgi:hypothetical protein
LTNNLLLIFPFIPKRKEYQLISYQGDIPRNICAAHIPKLCYKAFDIPNLFRNNALELVQIAYKNSHNRPSANQKKNPLKSLFEKSIYKKDMGLLLSDMEDKALGDTIQDLIKRTEIH